MMLESLQRGMARFINAVAVEVMGDIPADAPEASRAFREGSDFTVPQETYFTYDIFSHDERVSEDSVSYRRGQTGNPDFWYSEGERRGEVSIIGIGPDSGRVIEAMSILRRKPVIQAVLDANGLTLIEQGGANKLTDVKSSHHRTRYQRDFIFTYKRTIAFEERESVDAAEVIQTTATYTDEDPPVSPLVQVLTQTL